MMSKHIKSQGFESASLNVLTLKWCWYGGTIFIGRDSHQNTWKYSGSLHDPFLTGSSCRIPPFPAVT
jgi:hypothetical protein